MTRPPSSYLRPAIARMQGYLPGEQPRDAGYIKLNTNENPYPPSPLVIERLQAACREELRLYPDPQAQDLRRKLAAVFGVAVEQTIVGNGSDELLSIIMRSFVDPGQKVVFPHPTYSYFWQLIQIQEGEPIAIDFAEDFSLPAGLAVDDARVTLLVNPNAPSGTLIPLSEVDALAARVHGILVVDEAYVDFCDGGCLRLLERHPHLIVIRTMSKSFSLAGMRIGFGFAAPELIAGMWKVKDHYNLNRLSLVAAEAALEDLETMRRQAAWICRTRDDLIRQLRELGFMVWDSAANFVLARRNGPPSATELYRQLKQRRILIRHFDQPRLRDCLRITVGTGDQAAALLLELRQLLKS